ncbi:MAG: tetratricopeptide repeat protein [Fimbriimonadia bacterium]|jgi:tetratricopeptide (TPR) repeat protein
MRPVHRTDKYIDLAEWLCFDCGNPDLALEWVGRALHAEPENPEALTLKGDILQEAGRCEEAVTFYDRALEIVPDALEAIAERARALHTLERWDQAVAAAEAGLAVLNEITGAEPEPDPVVAMLHEIRVSSLLGSGQKRAAAQAVTEALERCPGDERLLELAALVRTSGARP